MKKYLDEGKFAAPRWLVYPNLSAWTIGWKMGYGEEYALNEPWHTDEFIKLFPQPQNWLFDFQNVKIRPVPLLGYLWREDGKAKYSDISGNCIALNDFITLTDIKEFTNFRKV